MHRWMMRKHGSEMKDSEEQTLQEEEIMADEKKPNVQQELYSIGEVSRICNVSKKALRF